MKTSRKTKSKLERNGRIEILVAEDSPTQAAYLQHFLEENGFKTIMASDGKQALELTREHKPSIVVSDVMMPGMDGYTLCREIRSDDEIKDTPFILLTALSDPIDIIRGLQSGADNFLRKPYDENYLLSRIEYILANRAIRRTNKMQLGIEIFLAGEKHFISSERQQILDLLISSYEQAIQLSYDLKARERELDRSNATISGLYSIAKALNQATTEREIVERALERAAQLPGVQGGWIILRHGDGFRVAATNGLSPALQESGALDGDCECRRMLLSGNLTAVTNILECERLKKANKSKGHAFAHAVVPLRGGNSDIGIMTLLGLEQKPFSDVDLRLLNGIGHQVAIALERAHVQEHLEKLVEQRTSALKASETRFRTMFETAAIGMALINRDGIAVICNNSLQRMLGYSEEELCSKKFIEFTHPDDVAVDWQLFQALLKREQDVYQIEKRLIRKDKDVIRVRKTISAIRSEDEAMRYAVSMVEDITEQNKVEMALRESEEKYRTLVNEVSDGFFVTDVHGVLTFANRALAEIEGFRTPEELLGRRFLEFVSPSMTEEIKKRFEQIISGERSPEILTIEIIRQDGALAMLEVESVVAVEHGMIVGIKGTVRDITERKKAEEEKKKLEAQLIQAQKMEGIGTLAGGVAHDFNNILGIILGHVSLLERAWPGPSPQKESVEAISKAVHRGAGLVRQLLTFARKTEPATGPVNVNLLIEELFTMLKETLPKTITLSKELHPHPPYISADVNQLHQAILNLSVNARDAMPRGGTLTFETAMVPQANLVHRFTTANAEQYIAVRVRDTGTGIDEQTRAHIFEPFFTTKELGKGTGLGLAVVYGIMSSHQGFIDIESEVGKGTTFHLYFPAQLQVVEVTPEKRERAKEQVIRGGTETILLVEDEEMLRELVKAVLEAKGYHVLTANDGIEAIEVYKAQQENIALVITDFGLPRLDGVGVVSGLQGISPAVKIIVASGYIEPTAKANLLQAGIEDLVSKPYDADEILAKIRAVIDD